MKNALLIGGGGTLGLYTAQELLKLGYRVDDICLEKMQSDHPALRFICAQADDALLRALFSEKRYDVIVDYLWYKKAEDWCGKRSDLLLAHTDQLFFLSSYRVYGPAEGPIREDTPQWLDVTQDPYLLQAESYALPKSRCEKYLRACGRENWTIVRPVISFSHFRLDLVTLPSGILLDRILRKKTILLPQGAKSLTAGVGWAGNVGKMIAALAGKEAALGEDFTLGSGENKTWGEVAGYYERLFGARFAWVDGVDYIRSATGGMLPDCWITIYDRLLNRAIDNGKMLRVTGLTLDDFVKIPEALEMEMNALLAHPEWKARMLAGANPEINRKMDAYLAAHGMDD